ncbi:MAG: hypothetical protein ACE5IO_07715 [Thermoplasmata archaeon]
MVAKKKKVESQELRSRPFWPGFFLEELSILFFFLGLTLILAAVLHPSQVFETGLERTELRGLESPANPFNTPPKVIPEWYFLAVFELLRYVAPWAVTVLIGILALAFLLTPFTEKFLSRYRVGDWIMRLVALGTIIVFLYLTLRGMGMT